jgi:uncharacterized membrane protein YkoI
MLARSRLGIGFLIAALVSAPSAVADSRKQDKVRQAVERGEIRSLSDTLGAIREKLPGEVVGIEIEREHGRWQYEFRVVDSKGHVFEVYVDARTSEISRVREK